MRTAHLTILALGALPLSAFAQSNLTDRIAGAPAGRVQFTFSAREGVCGNGRTFFTSGSGSFYGSWNDSERREPCEEGPMRVVLDRAGREVVSIATYAGTPQPAPEGTTDLGRVRAADAANYFLTLAEQAQGRVSRDAIMPAMMADSVDNTARLMAIARNQNAARETRRSAISWLGRPMDASERNVANVAGALVAIARDEDDNQGVRQSALRTLARLEHGAGTAALMELARNAERAEWLARESVTALNASSDPRARSYLRDVVRAADLDDDVLAAAIRGLGGEFATGDDVKILRDTYAKLPGDKSREAAVSAIANFGGTENVRWLLALAKDPDQTSGTRRRAMNAAYRGGTSVAEIIKIYDESTDTELKNSIMSTLMESGEKAALDKLMAIARNDDSASRRRRAVSLLGRSSDERVREFLASIATR